MFQRKEDALERIVYLATILRAIFAHSQKRAAQTEPERLKEECLQHLKAVGEAIQAFRADHDGQIPDWLSQLYPKYLKDLKTLRCPADGTGGSLSVLSELYDPHQPVSYLYEFNPKKMGKMVAQWPFEKNLPEETTFKAEKTRQLRFFGSMVPVARCFYHGGLVLSVAYSGRTYASQINWEGTPEANAAVREFFQLAIKRNPDGWEAEFDVTAMARYFHDQGNGREFQALLEMSPRLSMEGLTILKDLYQSAGELKKALGTCQRMVRQFPQSVEAHLELAKLSLATKDYEAARAAVERIQKLQPENEAVRSLRIELQAIAEVGALENEADQILYLGKLSELLLTPSARNALGGELLPKVRAVRTALRQSHGDPKSAAQAEQLYQAFEESLISHRGQWSHLNSASGLVNDYVQSIAQDSLGRLWFGTHYENPE
ncbi:tetratricopeptide repeat protein [Candidatus Poribacteria bacterium]|nr:tetratricopeptide repeat protein [Candidatus Poribacteria bacterium]